MVARKSVMVSKSATDRRHDYEQRIKELDRWHQGNAEAISFGRFYRQNYPKKYREWQTGHWQKDIAYRDSLIRSHSLDRLKRHHEDKKHSKAALHSTNFTFAPCRATVFVLRLLLNPFFLCNFVFWNVTLFMKMTNRKNKDIRHEPKPSE